MTDLSAFTSDEWLAALHAATADKTNLSHPIGHVRGQSPDGRWGLDVWVCSRFLRIIRRERVARDAALGNTLENLKYGWWPKTARSTGGRDGIFAITRDFAPRNEMMRKCFEKGLDSSAGTLSLEAAGMPKASATAVRVVSHAMRVLAFVAPSSAAGCFVCYRVLLWGIDRNDRS